MKTLILLVIIGFSANFVKGNLFDVIEKLPGCKITEEEFDSCVSLLNPIGNGEFKIPKNEEELDMFCEKATKALGCIRQFSRTCLPAFARTIAGIFQYDAKKMIKPICKSPAGRAEFLKHTQCGADGQLEPLRNCFNNYISQLEWMAKSVEKENLPTGTCCTLLQLHSCMKTKTKEICDSVTGPETAEYFDKTVSNALTESVENMCGEYNEFSKCSSQLTGDMWKKLFLIGEDPSKAGFERVHKSPFTVAIEIISKLN